MTKQISSIACRKITDEVREAFPEIEIHGSNITFEFILHIRIKNASTAFLFVRMLDDGSLIARTRMESFLNVKDWETVVRIQQFTLDSIKEFGDAFLYQL